MTQYRIEFKDLDVLCRICLTKIEKGIDLFSCFDTSTEDSTIASIIMECAPVTVVIDDKLSKIICQGCFELLKAAYQFRCLCMKSNDTLRKLPFEYRDCIKEEQPLYIKEEHSFENNYKTDDFSSNFINADVLPCNENFKESYDDNDGIIVSNLLGSPVEFKCSKCTGIFKNKWKLHRHQKLCPRIKRKRLITGEKFKYNLTTEKDKELSATPYGVAKDIIRENEDGRYACLICSKTFKGKYHAAEHAVIHTNFRYYCPHCDRKYAKTELLNRHIQNTHNVDQKVDFSEKEFSISNNRYNCEVCGKLFKRMAMLNVHLLSHSGIRPFKCEICERSFTDQRAKGIHSRTHKESDQRIKRDNRNVFLCSECGKSYCSKKALALHEPVHTGLKTFTCDICNKTFPRFTSLNRHQLQHTGEKPFDCHICEKKFTQSTHLNRHLKIHQGLKPYMCTFCSRNFSQKCNLKIHLRIHTGEKPFVCGFCDKGFYESRGLKKHKCNNNKRN